MKEEKFKKIVIGVTAAAVILFVILLVFMIYQLIAISVRRNRIEELQRQYDEWYEYVQSAESDIERYEGLTWLEIVARKLGMLGAGDYAGKGEALSFALDGGNVCLKISESGEFVYEICGD